MNANELANIWRKPIYLPYLQDPLTPEVLRAAEEELGRTLPRELVMMLGVQNGGYLRYELEGYPLDAISGIGEAHPSLTRFSWGEERECVSFELDGLLPHSAATDTGTCAWTTARANSLRSPTSTSNAMSKASSRRISLRF